MGVLCIVKCFVISEQVPGFAAGEDVMCAQLDRFPDVALLKSAHASAEAEGRITMPELRIDARGVEPESETLENEATNQEEEDRAEQEYPADKTQPGRMPARASSKWPYMR